MVAMVVGDQSQPEWRPRGWRLATLALGTLGAFAAVIATGIALTQMFGPRLANSPEAYQQANEMARSQLAQREARPGERIYAVLPVGWRAKLKPATSAASTEAVGRTDPDLAQEVRLYSADTAYLFWAAAGAAGAGDGEGGARGLLARQLGALIADIDVASSLHAASNDPGSARAARTGLVGLYTVEPSNLAARAAALRSAFGCFVMARRGERPGASVDVAAIGAVEEQIAAVLLASGLATPAGLAAGQELGRQAWEAARRPGC